MNICPDIFYFFYEEIKDRFINIDLFVNSVMLDYNDLIILSKSEIIPNIQVNFNIILFIFMISSNIQQKENFNKIINFVAKNKYFSFK